MTSTPKEMRKFGWNTQLNANLLTLSVKSMGRLCLEKGQLEITFIVYAVLVFQQDRYHIYSECCLSVSTRQSTFKSVL